MAALEKRVEILEGQMEHVIRVLDQFATNQLELDKVLATLADSHIKTQEQFRETDQRLRETEALLQETIRESRANKLEADARGREMDARIDRLVSGIGEFIRQANPKPN